MPRASLVVLALVVCCALGVVGAAHNRKGFAEDRRLGQNDLKLTSKELFGDRAIRAIEQQTDRAVRNIMNAIGPYSDLASNLIWSDAIEHCESKGKQLCTAKEYCPDGPGRRPAGGTLVGKIWAPTSDAHNEWLSIGEEQNIVCKTHTSLFKHTPSWGTKPVQAPFKGPLKCCDPDMDKLKKPKSTWDDAVEYCADKNQRICNLKEYCKDGAGLAPQGGVVGDAWWAPVYDDINEWVAIGSLMATRLLCRTHTDIVGRTPSWSLSNTAGPPRGRVMCCADEFINVPGKLTWLNAHMYCYERKMRLCTRDEYCPEGQGYAPRGGERPGEAWAAVSDAENEWVSVGFTNPGRLCKTHSEVLGTKPEWGKAGGWRGHLQCCSGPKPGIDEQQEEVDRAKIAEQREKMLLEEETKRRLKMQQDAKAAEEGSGPDAAQEQETKKLVRQAALADEAATKKSVAEEARKRAEARVEVINDNVPKRKEEAAKEATRKAFEAQWRAKKKAAESKEKLKNEQGAKQAESHKKLQERTKEQAQKSDPDTSQRVWTRLDRRGIQHIPGAMHGGTAAVHTELYSGSAPMESIGLAGEEPKSGPDAEDVGISEPDAAAGIPSTELKSYE